MMNVRRHSILTACVGLTLFAVGAASAQESLTDVQSLYASARYEEALASLNRMRANGLPSHDVPAVEQYRAFCLLALGRGTEAEEAIAAVITAMPSYTPPDRDVSPRVRSAFHDVRRRVVPSVVQQKYGDAKAAFERKEYVAARDGFAQVTSLLADPGLADLAGQPPLADLALLAKGFHDLAVTSQAPPPSVPEPPVAPRTTPVASVASASARERAGELRRDLAVAASGRDGGPVVYTAADAQVAPPAIVRQALPPYPRRPLMPMEGVVEVVIDERGTVESATMRESVDLVYDALALAAARSWQYKPATRDGVPVKYRKGVQVRIQP